MAVARAGVMEPFANHTFQPRRRRAPRRSGAGGQPAARARRARSAGARESVAERARAVPRYVAGTHLAYPAASAAVAAGVITAGGRRQLPAVADVTGAEAIDAIERLQALADILRSDDPRP